MKSKIREEGVEGSRDQGIKGRKRAEFFLGSFLGLAALVASGCEKERSHPSSPLSRAVVPIFSDVTADAGLDFVHYTGATGEFYVPEIMGAGCALFDYDVDGDLDVYAVQGALFDKREKVEDALFPPRDAVPRNTLYRSELTGSGRRQGELFFTDVTDQAGVGDTGYGMGVAVGDYDNDGHPDLYVTNFGPNVLFHNDGDGTFTDVTRAAGVDDPRFSASAAFLDYDRDGRLDLFVTNYVDFSIAVNRRCTRLGGQLDYCGPLSYEAVSDRLYHNDGDGGFTDVSVSAAIYRAYGNGLGVVCADFDDDGWVDIFVANDATPNQLWINRQNGSFENKALIAGVAVNAAGRNEAGMGVCTADFDRDGDAELFLTHERGETNTYYLNLGSGLFEDDTAGVRLADPSLPYASFGTVSFDYDGDGWSDLFVTNGAVRKLANLVGERHPYHQADQLFLNGGGRFVETTAVAGLDPDAPRTGRGVACGDVDNDGDLDLLVASNSGRLRLLVNNGSNHGHWIQLLLEGRRSGRDAYGSRLVLELQNGVSLVRRVGTDGSYLSASDKRVHLGLGREDRMKRLSVHWSSGAKEEWPGVKLNALTTLREGEGQRVK